MLQKHQIPDHEQWIVGMTVDIGNAHNLLIVAILHDERCSTFSLVGAKGRTYRYAPPLYQLQPTN
jgi:hypothetical protein